MSKKIYVFVALALALVVFVGFYYTSADAKYEGEAKKAVVTEKPVKVETCYGCHGPIKELHTLSEHAKVN